MKIIIYENKKYKLLTIYLFTSSKRASMAIDVVAANIAAIDLWTT
jgi:hypothetical protein